MLRGLTFAPAELQGFDHFALYGDQSPRPEFAALRCSRSFSAQPTCSAQTRKFLLAWASALFSRQQSAFSWPSAASMLAVCSPRSCAFLFLCQPLAFQRLHAPQLLQHRAYGWSRYNPQRYTFGHWLLAVANAGSFSSVSAAKLPQTSLTVFGQTALVVKLFS